MKKNEQSLNIGSKVVDNLYQNASLEANESQPIYILHRDTIRDFMHKTIQFLGIKERLLGFIGIEFTLIVALSTSTFVDTIGIKGNIIQGTFIAFAIIIALLILKDIWSWWKMPKKCDVDALVEELSKQGSVIKNNNQ